MCKHMCMAPQKATVTLVSLCRQKRLGVFVWEGEKENRRNGTMKTLSHQETKVASGEKLRKARQEEGTVAALSTEKVNREFNDV